MVGADVVFLHGCPQSCMPNPVEGLLEVFEDMLDVDVMLVLETFLTEDSWVEDLLCRGPPFCEACPFFSNNLPRLWLQSVQHALKHDFAWVTDEADRAVVLTLLHVAYFGKCDDQGLGPWSWPFSSLPDLVADCRDSSNHVLSICLEHFFWDVVNSS